MKMRSEEQQLRILRDKELDELTARLIDESQDGDHETLYHDLMEILYTYQERFKGVLRWRK